MECCELARVEQATQATQLKRKRRHSRVGPFETYINLLVFKTLLQVLIDGFVLDFGQEGHVAHAGGLFLDALLKEVGLLRRIGLFGLGCLLGWEGKKG